MIHAISNNFSECYRVTVESRDQVKQLNLKFNLLCLKSNLISEMLCDTKRCRHAEKRKCSNLPFLHSNSCGCG